MTSVNVACGFHAGDPLTIRRTVRLALDAGAAIGAHPGYPDLVGFGRRDLAMTPDDLEAAVLYQVAALAGIVRAEGGRLRHVKPHGALYHHAAADPAVRRRGRRGRRPPRPRAPARGRAGSALAAAGARAGLRVVVEGFADRVYEPDGTPSARGISRAPSTRTPPPPRPRPSPSPGTGACAPATAPCSRSRCDTLCVHGDTPGAAAIAAAVRQALAAAGVEVRAADG